MHMGNIRWLNGKWDPFNGKMLRMYIMSMREVVEAYKNIRKNQKHPTPLHQSTLKD